MTALNVPHYLADLADASPTAPTDGYALVWVASTSLWTPQAVSAGSSGADLLATYLVQTAAGAPANAQILASLATGLVKVTTGTGVLSTAAAGTDYLTPAGSGAALTGLTVAQVTGAAVDSAVVHIAGIEDITGTKNFYATVHLFADGSVDRLSADINGPALSFQKRGSVAGGANAVIANTSVLGTFSFNGWNSLAYGTGAQIVANARQDWNSAAQGTALRFYTVPTNSTTKVSRIQIDHSGYVGIGNNPGGTYNASCILDLNAGATGDLILKTKRFAAGSTGNQYEAQDESGVPLFCINPAGNLIKLRSVTYSWPSSQGAAGTFLGNDGAGTLAWGIGPASRSFGVSGTPVLNATTPPIYLDRAYTCNGAVAACDTAPAGSAATLTLQSSTDGSTWSTLVVLTISVGAFFSTAACTTSLAAGTWLRGKFTAVNGVANLTGTIFLKG